MLSYIFPSRIDRLKARQIHIAEDIAELELEAIRIKHLITMLKEQKNYFASIFPTLIPKG
jgi:hypothetical protein